MIQLNMQKITRRNALGFLGGALATSLLPNYSFSSEKTVNEIISEISKGTAVDNVRIDIDIPQQVENGRSVSIAFEIHTPMTPENFVKSAYIVADGNPEPVAATFNFTPFSGSCYAKTRIRLFKTQNVHVLALFSDGSFGKTSSPVKVEIGACEG